MTKPLFRSSVFAGLLCVCGVFALDLSTKTLIVELVMQPPRTIPVTSFLNLTLGFNDGVSFGLFADFFRQYPALLVALTVGITIAVLALMARTPSRVEAVGLGAIAGGALGNIYDRTTRGAVVDFLDIHVGDWHWPAFNLADVEIVGGALLVTLATLLAGRRADRAAAPE